MERCVLRKLMVFLRRETVLSIAWLLAAATALLVPPDRAYLGYIDGGVAPIVGDRGFDPLYINPIPSGLVLTGIVVSVSITAFSLALIQRIYRRYGTIEMRELLDRAKKEDD